MLTSLSVKDFKSFADATISFGGPIRRHADYGLSLLIGENASGKTNFVEALELVSWLARGRRVRDVMSAIRERELSVRGTPGSFVRAGKTSCGFKVGLDDPPDVDLNFELAFGETPRVAREVFVAHARTQYQTLGASANDGALRVELATGRSGRKPVMRVRDDQLVLTQRWPKSAGQWDEDPIRDFVADALAQVSVLDPVPAAMRTYAFEVDHALKRDGSNVSAALLHLCERKKQREHVLRFLGALNEKVIDVDFIRTPRAEVMLRLSETFGGKEREMDASLLSDGTLRILALAAAVLSAEPESLVVVEEFDNGIHASRLQHVMKQLEALAATRKIVVFATTHNPAVLDCLGEDSLPRVHAAFRDAAGASRISRLAELPHFADLLSTETLGNLVTRGVLQRHLENPEGLSAKQRAVASQWVRQLRRSGTR